MQDDPNYVTRGEWLAMLICFAAVCALFVIVVRNIL